MNKLLDRIRILKRNFDSGDIPRLAEHEVHPDLPLGDRINYIYFTLPVSINFQRSSPAMWKSALKTYNDSKTRYLFYPEQVVKTDRDKVQTDLLKHGLALQRNKHTDIWRTISQTLVDRYNSDPREIISSNNFDVKAVIETVRVTEKKCFPYLSGSKIANFWLFILNQYTDVQLKNLDLISVIPDTHVIQSTIKLGIIDAEIDRDELAQLWHEILKGSELMPIDIHPVLWNWSRNKFLPDV